MTYSGFHRDSQFEHLPHRRCSLAELRIGPRHFYGKDVLGVHRESVREGQTAHGIEGEIFTKAIVTARALTLRAGPDFAESVEDVDRCLDVGCAHRQPGHLARHR